MIIKNLVCLGILLLSSAVFAAENIDMKVFYGKEELSASVVLIEREPGKLKALVDTLTEQKSLQLLVKNNNESITIICETSKISTSCRFQFKNQFPDIVVHKGQGFYVKSQDLKSFSGLEMLNRNPNLEIPFEVQNSAREFFKVYFGNGKLEAGGGLAN